MFVGLPNQSPQLTMFKRGRFLQFDLFLDRLLYVFFFK